MRDYCDAQAGFWLHSKFWSKFSRKPLSGISDQKAPPPPHFGKLQIWDDQSLLRNTPPISENFRFGMTKVYSGIPPPISENFRFGMTKVYSGIPPPIFENFRFGMTKVYSGIPPPPRRFKNAESYYMWRLYPTGITTRCSLCVS